MGSGDLPISRGEGGGGGLEAVRAKVLGKTAVITDLAEEELTAEKLVEGFVARAEVEEDFKGLKDGHAVPVKPFWMWHDATVAGHTFLCVMGLLLLRYLQWELRELDLSIKELVKKLEKIRVVLVRGEDGKPQIEPGEFHPHLKASGVGPAIGVRTTTGFSPRNSLRCPGTAQCRRWNGKLAQVIGYAILRRRTTHRDQVRVSSMEC